MPIIDINKIKADFKSSGHEDSKNIFSFIIRCTGQNIQPPKKGDILDFGGRLTPEFIKSETNDRLILSNID